MGILSRGRQSDKPRPWRLGAALIGGGILAVQVGMALLDREYDALGEQLAELHAAALPARGQHAGPRLAVVDDGPKPGWPFDGPELERDDLADNEAGHGGGAA